VHDELTAAALTPSGAREAAPRPVLKARAAAAASR
jgi:hypothetical protein